jgi:hypothetical protein
MNQHDPTQRSVTPTRSWAANSYQAEVPYCSETQACYSKTTEISRMDRPVSHFPTLPSYPNFPVLPLSLATLSSRMLCQPCWQPPVAISVSRWLAETSWTIRNEWRATSVIPSTYGTAFCGFCVHINSDTRAARLFVRLTSLAATQLPNTAWRRRVTCTVRVTVKHTVPHSPQATAFCQLLSRSSQSPCIYITGHSLRPFLHDVTVKNIIKMITEIKQNCCCCYCCET